MTATKDVRHSMWRFLSRNKSFDVRATKPAHLRRAGGAARARRADHLALCGFVSRRPPVSRASDKLPASLRNFGGRNKHGTVDRRENFLLKNKI